LILFTSRLDCSIVLSLLLQVLGTLAQWIMPRLFKQWNVALSGPCLWFWLLYGVTTELYRSMCLCVLKVLIYGITKAVYNAYFHPLAKFPGPLSAAVSNVSGASQRNTIITMTIGKISRYSSGIVLVLLLVPERQTANACLGSA